MYLSDLVVLNFRSCKHLKLNFQKDTPNIFIGINDCGKTTLLKAIGLLLEEKPIYYSIKENSSKKDLSNSPLTEEDFLNILQENNIPPLPYNGNETYVFGKFISEDQDIDQDSLSTYSDHLLWVIERSPNDIWLAKTFEANNPSSKTLLLTPDIEDSNGKGAEFWGLTQRDIDKKVKEADISSEQIKNQNGKGRFSNLEKVRALYSMYNLDQRWSQYKIDKGDKNVFPTFRYLDWHSSLEDIKKIASDAMAMTIQAQLKPIRVAAAAAAVDTEKVVNQQLTELHSAIADTIPNITAIKTKIYFDVKESITDIFINKLKGDGDIHLDLQGEGVKRQIWFALIKSGALSNIKSEIKNKKFIWAFDEPETHLYPSAQRQFFEIIKDVSMSNAQTFICTHSTVFIDKSKLKNIKTINLNDNAYSEYSECSNIDEIFEALELRNSDFLFYDKFLIIEGDTESHLIPELYKLFSGRSLEEDNIQVVNLTGKSKWLDNKKALENVLKGFKKSFDYVVYLFDADMAHELGADAITQNFFFVGVQDIEDSISSHIWQKVVEKATNGEIVLTTAEIDQLKSEIPKSGNLAKQDKFFPKLEKLTKLKWSEKCNDSITWNVLPSKGGESAATILEFLKNKEDIPTKVSDAFARLQFKETTTLDELEIVKPNQIVAEIPILENTIAPSDHKGETA